MLKDPSETTPMIQASLVGQTFGLLSGVCIVEFLRMHPLKEFLTARTKST